MTHVELLLALTSRIRAVGPAAALDELRAGVGADHPVARHHTLAVFFVWAVARLVDAGLSDAGVLWHPLTDPRSPLAWYDAETLASEEARSSFVPSTLAAAGDPVPEPPRVLVAC